MRWDGHATAHRGVTASLREEPFALRVRPPLDQPRGTFQWPTGSPARVLRAFEAPASRWGAGHRGVDLAVAEGAEIRSAGPGRVVFAGTVATVPVVSVAHGGGLRTTYQPVRARLVRGSVVRTGDVIGTLDFGAFDPGHCREACLHWGARVGSAHRAHYLDPLALLRPLRYRLVPDTQ